jgi:hypothetical protein
MRVWRRAKLVRSGVERDDLAVEDEVALEVAEHSLDLRVGVDQLLAAAGEEQDLPVGDVGDGAFAIELALEDPGRVRDVVAGQGGEHRVEPSGETLGTQLYPPVCREPVPHVHAQAPNG